MRGDHLWLGWHAVVQLGHQRATMAPRSGGYIFGWHDDMGFGLAVWLCSFVVWMFVCFRKDKNCWDIKVLKCVLYCMILISMISPAMTTMYKMLWRFTVILFCCVTLEKLMHVQSYDAHISHEYIVYTCIYYIYIHILCMFANSSDVGMLGKVSSKARIHSIVSAWFRYNAQQCLFIFLTPRGFASHNRQLEQLESMVESILETAIRLGETVRTAQGIR